MQNTTRLYETKRETTLVVCFFCKFISFVNSKISKIRKKYPQAVNFRAKKQARSEARNPAQLGNIICLDELERQQMAKNQEEETLIFRDLLVAGSR